MVARLPEEFIVPDIAHKVGLEEQSKAVYAIFGRIDIVVVILLLLAQSNLLVVVI